jgi:histone deacetylase 1/2
MKPERIAMAHSLVVSTGLYRHLHVYQARQASKEEMGRFHSEDYLNYLEQYVSKDISNKFINLGIDRFAYPTPQLSTEAQVYRQHFKVGDSTDCPAFNGLYNLCQISSGGSIDAACLLLNG